MAAIQPHDPYTKLLSAVVLFLAWLIGGGMSSLHDLDDEGL
jgi:hypothetical protein